MEYRVSFQRLEDEDQIVLNGIEIPDSSTAINTAPCSDPLAGFVKSSSMWSRSSILEQYPYNIRLSVLHHRA